jgi:hypothetical protein
MKFFIVTMTHPDGEGWNRHLAAHVYPSSHRCDGSSTVNFREGSLNKPEGPGLSWP